MALRAILLTRGLISFSLTSGSAIDLSPGGLNDGAWPTFGVDYANLGSEVIPPTLAYVNEIDSSPYGKVGILLPLSAEGEEIVTGGGVVLPQFRRAPAYQGDKKFR